ncbi:MAG TPA: ABC transporter permease [Gemmatimonadaceae bacterium]|jgi:putative ABC transport system permease protein|nr:ABC transporter permease [Gemmatimonadaceae bacterium]
MTKTAREWLSRCVATLRRSRRDADLADEIGAHLAELMNEHVRRGLPLHAARAAARREFGGVDQVKEQYREQRSLPWLDALVQDVAYGVRTLRREPVFAVVALLTLALGVGAATTIFGGVKAVLLDPLPYPHADRIVAIAEMRRDDVRIPGTFGMYRGLAAATRVFDSLAVAKSWQPTLTGAGRPERLEGQRVSARYFDVLGVGPARGRVLQSQDDRPGAPNVAVLSDTLWRRHFSGDLAVIGSAITLDDRAYVVIGVAPAGFEDVLAPSAEIWTALQYDMSLGAAWGHHLRTIGRLRPGVAVDRASRDVNTAGHAVLDEQHPETYRGDTTFVVFPLGDDMTRAAKPMLVAVAGAVSLVLLVACVNVTNLLLARGARRRSEFAIRIALGASRRRVIRQLLTESLLLASAGGACGIVVATLGVRVLGRFVPADLPRAAAIRVDGSVLVFALAITAIVGVLVGLMPALDSIEVPANARQGASRSVTARTNTRRALVSAEVAMALVLLVTTGLLFHSLQRLFAVPAGFESGRAITMQVQTSGQRLDKPATDRFFERALSAVRAVPGVRAAGFTSQLPLSGDDDEYGVRFEGDDPRSGYNCFRYAVSEGYFESIGIPLHRGRVFDERDSSTTPRVAVISKSLARRKFGPGDPIGRRLHVGPPDAPWYTIVGVVGDVRQLSLAVTQPDAIYIVSRQSWFVDRALSLVARVGGNAVAMAPAIRDAIWSVDKDQPVLRVATMDALIAASAGARRFALTLFEAFALSALALAGIGLYGVVSGNVGERTRELAIRSALGASRTEVLSLVLRQGMRMTIIGIGAGLGGALAAGRGIATLLFGITPLDPVTYVGVTVLLLAVATVASGVPAWRASRVDPMAALRQE